MILILFSSDCSVTLAKGELEGELEFNIWIMNFFIKWEPEHWRRQCSRDNRMRGWYTVGEKMGTFRGFRGFLSLPSRFLLE